MGVRWTAIVIATALGVGGFCGWMLRGEPPPPAPTVSQSEVSSSKATAHAATSFAATSNMTVGVAIPATSTTKWRIKYKDAPDGGCAIDEASGESTKAGPGSIVISSNQDTKAATSEDSEQSADRDVRRIETPPPPPPEPPRFTGGVGAFFPVLNPKDVAPAMSLGVRLFGVTGRVIARAPLSDPLKVEAGAMVEFPLQ